MWMGISSKVTVSYNLLQILFRSLNAFSTFLKLDAFLSIPFVVVLP